MQPFSCMKALFLLRRHYKYSRDATARYTALESINISAAFALHGHMEAEGKQASWLMIIICANGRVLLHEKHHHLNFEVRDNRSRPNINIFTFIIKRTERLFIRLSEASKEILASNFIDNIIMSL